MYKIYLRKKEKEKRGKSNKSNKSNVWIAKINILAESIYLFNFITYANHFNLLITKY